MNLGDITPKSTADHKMMKKGFSEGALSIYAAVGGYTTMLLLSGMKSTPFHSLLLTADLTCSVPLSLPLLDATGREIHISAF